MRIITLSYRKVITTQHDTPWEKLVFESAYQEYKLQAQYYNQGNTYFTYAELLKFSKGADKLPYLVSAAITGYLTQLNEKVPDIMNNQGKTFLVFKKFNFEILAADIRQSASFKIAINFYSELLTWVDTIGNYLVLADGTAQASEGYLTTDLVQIQPYLNIHSLKMEG